MESRVDANDMKKKAECRLENWRVARTSRGTILIGQVMDHPNLADGTKVTTNPLESLDESARIAETLNNIYHLGKRGR